MRFSAGLREDPSDLFKRLTASPHPVYPELARRAGIEGIVRLQVKVKRDGTIEVQKVLEGEPMLADAAMDAAQKVARHSRVDQWDSRRDHLDDHI